MSIFSSKTKTTPKAPKVTKPAKAASTALSVKGENSASSNSCNAVIIKPHVTEKAGIQNESLNVYTFQVSPEATKHSVARAITSLYKVMPSKVRIVNLPRKEIFVRGKWGTQKAIKKALVYLKKGDKIA